MAKKPVNVEPQTVDFVKILEDTIKNLEEAKKQLEHDSIVIPARIDTYREVAEYMKSNRLRVVQDPAPEAEAPAEATEEAAN